MLCVRSTLDIAVRVEFMARHVPSMYPHRREMIQVEASETLFVSFPCINSLHMFMYSSQLCNVKCVVYVVSSVPLPCTATGRALPYCMCILCL